MSVIIPATGFLRLPQVLALVPVGKSSWWEGCKSGRYPVGVFVFCVEPQANKPAPQGRMGGEHQKGGPTSLVLSFDFFT